jgi:hypothetical protein
VLHRFDHLRKHKFNEKQYDTALRSIQIVNGDRDTRASVSLREGLFSTGRWDDRGKLISINDPLLNEYDVPLSPDESIDSLHFTDADGSQRVCTHFGLIAKEFLSTQTLCLMAKTLLHHSDELQRCCNEGMGLNAALRTLRDAASDMRKIPHDKIAEVNQELTAHRLMSCAGLPLPGDPEEPGWTSWSAPQPPGWLPHHQPVHAGLGAQLEHGWSDAAHA